jgi:hypothetical protein
MGGWAKDWRLRGEFRIVASFDFGELRDPRLDPMNLTVEQAFQPAGSGDFPVARSLSGRRLEGLCLISAARGHLRRSGFGPEARLGLLLNVRQCRGCSLEGRAPVNRVGARSN